MTPWSQMPGKMYRVALLLPFAWWAYRIYSGLGPDPAKTLNHLTGDIALYYLFGNLAIGILIAFRFRFPPWLRFLAVHRRYLGVLTFLILVLHVLLYLTMESFGAQAFTQLYTKLYLILGAAAWLLLLALTVTSYTWAVRRLGGKRWKRVHRVVYLAAALVTVHVMLIEKIDRRLFVALFVALWLAQGVRLARWITSRSS